MSHALGIASLPDGEKYYFEYDGTSDICCTRLYLTIDEVWKNWRKDNSIYCSCEDEKNKIVMLSTSYGHWHFLFESKICEKCMAITGKIMEMDSL